MSISPVPAIGPANLAQPDSGTPPKQEARVVSNDSPSQELPQDEVEVQRDQTTTEIVIKYLDRSGSVILQVPSSEVLSVAHAIDQDLADEAKLRASAGAAAANGEGGKDHGH